MSLRSTFRNGFLIQPIAKFMALGGIAYIIFLVLEDDGTTYWVNQNRIVIGVIAFLWIWGGYIFIGFRTVFTMVLTTQHFEIRRLFGKTSKYDYSQIISINTERATSSRSWSNSGYQLLKLELSDDSTITISENMYNNYIEIKTSLYKQL